MASNSMTVLMVRCHGIWHTMCTVNMNEKQRTEYRKIALKSLPSSGFGSIWLCCVALSSVSLNAFDRSHVKCVACFYWNPTLLLIIYGILSSCIFYQSISVYVCVGGTMKKKACSVLCQKLITETFFGALFSRSLSLSLSTRSLDDNLSEKFKRFFGVCEYVFFHAKASGKLVYSV